MKVFGIGLNKTGTTTLAECMRMFGFAHTSCSLELTKCVQAGNLAPVFECADRKDSFEDWPWPLVYEKMDRRYDDAKFILTVRENSETWFDSLRRHALRTGPTEFRKIAYGYEMPLGKKEEHIRVYRRHNESVRAYFSDRDDLLELCWETGDRWERLARFLDVPVPNEPFPHAKKGRSTVWSLLSYAKNLAWRSASVHWKRLTGE